MKTIHSSHFMSIIHSPSYMEMIHSSFLWRLFLFVGKSGTSPRPCAEHALLRPVARAGPRRDGKGRRRIAAPAWRAQRSSSKKRCWIDVASLYFTPRSSSSVSSTFKSVCAVMRSFCWYQDLTIWCCFCAGIVCFIEIDRLAATFEQLHITTLWALQLVPCSRPCFFFPPYSDKFSLLTKVPERPPSCRKSAWSFVAAVNVLIWILPGLLHSCSLLLLFLVLLRFGARRSVDVFQDVLRYFAYIRGKKFSAYRQS